MKKKKTPKRSPRKSSKVSSKPKKLPDVEMVCSASSGATIEKILGPMVNSGVTVEIPSSPIDKNAQLIDLEAVLAVEAGIELFEPEVVSISDPPAAERTERPSPVKSTVQTRDSKPAKLDSWANLVKGSTKQLQKRGQAFTLESGEACVKIPNGVIERNKKSWEFFILGQFYTDPPSHGTLHNIVNGIWSKQMRDITVSRMEGNSFLFRIPNSHTRHRVLNQRLWQIDGKTMFVAKWEPGVIPVKPELTSAPIWLELRNVPFQFFNEEGLEHIAGLVGEPKGLHPDTANKTNLEVAKVLTIIDPRRPLPEAVNAQFESGEIRRINVSSPWMPPVCSHCKEVGHSLKHCKRAPITCKGCKATTHSEDKCPRSSKLGPNKTGSQLRRRRRSKTPKGSSSNEGHWAVKGFLNSAKPPPQSQEDSSRVIPDHISSLGDPKNQHRGESSNTMEKNSGITRGRLVQVHGKSIEVDVKGSQGTCEDSELSPEPDPDTEPERDSDDEFSCNSEEEAILGRLDKTQQKVNRGKSLKASL
ncbi:hypothetical protein AALP_AA7G122800 [Arabis alpina]|uniref:DUF4283 domain-containing protein n=1 Tax=Arabis alpina TaxID=50452 RepID=A0A087GHK0_ARAAL|nr:hypothetical protein AALP_AA7G122800 [Arabis alpina]